MEYTITPPRGILAIEWSEIWRFRDLFVTLTLRDVAVRYKQTILGVAWVVLQPVATMAIFTLVFHRLAGIDSPDGTPYPVFFYMGMLIWQYFSTALANASQSVIADAALIQKVYFPRILIPSAAVASGLVDLAVSSVVLAGLMVWTGCVPRWEGIALIPVFLLVTVLSAAGLGYILAALNVKYRDVRYALPFVIQILMFVTPVIYPVQLLDKVPRVRLLMEWLNPMAAVITNARAGLLGRSPLELRSLAIAATVSVAIFLFGLCYFRRTERFFSDIA